MKLEQEFARIISFFLWRHQAVEVREQEPFQLASGLYSPIYINCRCLISFPGAREIVISFAEYLYHEKEMNADGVAGGETAGIPFGAWLAQRLDKPFVYVRKKRKTYGTSSRVEGSPFGRILLFEDLITDGLSKVGFIDALREADCMVSDCLVILDREAGGSESLEKLGVRLHPLVRLSACLEVGEELGFLTPDSLRQVRHYLSDARAWHASRGLPYQESSPD